MRLKRVRSNIFPACHSRAGSWRFAKSKDLLAEYWSAWTAALRGHGALARAAFHGSSP